MELNLYEIFPGANYLIQHEPKQVASVYGGVGLGYDLNIAVFATAPDPMKVQGCVLCLCEFLDGSPVIVRYEERNIHANTNRHVYVHHQRVRGGS